MPTLINKFRIAALLLICVSIFATCEFVKSSDNSSPPLQDTIFLNQWRREKAEKIKLIAQYESRLTQLQSDKDSLQTLVIEKKKIIFSNRIKTNQLQEQLKQVIAKADTSKIKIEPDSIRPIIDSLFIAEAQSDTACDKTISTLEEIVANRDSSILIQKQVEINLKDLQKEEELKNRYLTEQLNSAYKSLRKKSRHTKLLAGGLLILSGITTSLLISQSIK